MALQTLASRPFGNAEAIDRCGNTWVGGVAQAWDQIVLSTDQESLHDDRT